MCASSFSAGLGVRHPFIRVAVSQCWTAYEGAYTLCRVERLCASLLALLLEGRVHLQVDERQDKRDIGRVHDLTFALL